MICAIRRMGGRGEVRRDRPSGHSTQHLRGVGPRHTRAGDLEIIREGQNLDLGHRTGGEVRQGAK
jgi:hypothetical protein